MSSNTKEFTIEPTNGRAVVKFTGRHLATVDVKRDNSVRWAEWHAYETESGKIVIEQVGRTLVEGETTFIDYLVFENEEQMTKKLGTGKLAEKLYDRLGVEVITIL